MKTRFNIYRYSIHGGVESKLVEYLCSTAALMNGMQTDFRISQLEYFGKSFLLLVPLPDNKIEVIGDDILHVDILGIDGLWHTAFRVELIETHELKDEAEIIADRMLSSTLWEFINPN